MYDTLFIVLLHCKLQSIKLFVNDVSSVFLCCGGELGSINPYLFYDAVHLGKAIILRLIASIQQPAWTAWAQQRMSTSRKEQVVTVRRISGSVASLPLTTTSNLRESRAEEQINLIGHNDEMMALFHTA